jgi:hypothetical protein
MYIPTYVIFAHTKIYRLGVLKAEGWHQVLVLRLQEDDQHGPGLLAGQPVAPLRQR